MANTDSPKGFRPLEEGPLFPVSVDASNGTTIGKGDPLEMEADGGYGRAEAGDAALVKYIAWGFKDSDGNSISYLPASTAGTVTAIPVTPGRKFIVQSDTGTNVAATAVNATADFVVANCSTTSGVSQVELDASDIGTGTQLRILGKLEEPNNSWGEAHVDLIVEFSENATISSTSV